MQRNTVIKLIQVVIFLLIASSTAVSQTPANFPEIIKTELTSKGISQEQLYIRLQERGLNPNELSQQQLIALEPEIREIIKELQNENSEEPVVTKPEIAEKIADKIDEGATIEEAVQEEIIESSIENNNDISNKKEQNIYGHQIFKNGSLSVFRTNGDASAPDTYQLGSGDELAISIFGASQADFLLRIDNQGFISPPGLPKILVQGISVGQARNLVESRFANYYRFARGQFSLNVNGARTIRVNIFGEVKQSGTYSFSALNGALNALVAAGGPTQSGSVRLVQLNRGKDRKIIDIYKYLSNPSEVDQDLNLENGDAIFVPLSKTIVRIEGAVKRPMFYELLRNEGLKDLLELSGGLTPGAYPELIQIERLVDGRLTLIDHVFEKVINGKTINLLNGDIIRVKAFENPDEDYVEVKGAVQVPGKLAYNKKLKVSDVLAQAKLRTNARTDIGFLRRQNTDGTSNLIQINLEEVNRGGKENLFLKSGDIIEVLSQNTYVDNTTIAVSGAVRNPILNYPFSYDGSLTVENAILLAGGRTSASSEKALLFRREKLGSKITNYKLLNLEDSNTGKIRLNPNDSIVVFPKDKFIDDFSISINGAVRSPGTYKYDPSLGIKELLTLAGGTTIDAATNRLEIFRLIYGNNENTKTKIASLDISTDINMMNKSQLPQLEPFDIVVVRSVPEFELTRLVEIEGEVRFPGYYPITDDIVRISDLLKAAGGTTNQAFPSGATLHRKSDEVGVVVLELQTIISNTNSPNNITLLPGDKLLIPKAKELVSIGTVGTQINKIYIDTLQNTGNVSLAFQGRHSAKWYVQNYAGGFAKRAERKSLTVRNASGKTERTKSFLSIKTYPKVKPGSTINISLKQPKKEKPPREPVDWASIASVIMAGLTTTLTTILIIDRLSDTP